MNKLVALFLLIALPFTLSSLNAEDHEALHLGDYSLEINHQGPETVSANASATYTVDVKNPHIVPAYQVEVIAYLHGSKLLSASGNGSYDQAYDAVVWRVGRMQAESAASFSYEIQTKADGYHEVCAFAKGQFVDCVRSEVTKPKLLCNVELPPVCSTLEPLQAELAITNKGDRVAKATKMQVNLNNLVFAKSDKSAKTFTATDVPAGETIYKTVTLRALADGAAAVKARVKAANTSETFCQDSIDVATPSLTITKTAPPKVFVEDKFRYQISLTNDGNAPTTGTILYDELPAGVDFVSANPDARYDSAKNVVNWRIGTLEPGETVEAQITVAAIKEKAAPGWENLAAATCEELEPVQATALTILERVPALNIAVADNIDPVVVGSEVIYTVVVNNESQEEATNVGVIFNVPSEGKYISHKGVLDALNPAKIAGEFRAEEGKIYFEPVDVLAPGDGMVFKIAIQAKEAGSVIGRATASFEEFGEPFSAEEPTTFYQE